MSVGTDEIVMRNTMPAGPIVITENPIAQMLSAMVSQGITSETAAAMEKMTDLYLKVESANAQRAFAAAKCALQAELPPVVAMRIIPSNDGTVRSSFAAYEDIMAKIAPFLTKHGFSISFTMRNDSANGKDRICAVCKLTHSGGHSETNEFAVRISAPPKSSDAQADGATRSYARRGALCDCLNVIIDHDNDARLEGAFVSAEVARALENRVRASGGDVKAFLKLAGAESFDKIREGSVTVLDGMLTAKERSKKQPAQTPSAPHDDANKESHSSEAALGGSIKTGSVTTQGALPTQPIEPQKPRPTKQQALEAQKDAWDSFRLTCEETAAQAGLPKEKLAAGIRKMLVKIGAVTEPWKMTPSDRVLLLKAIAEKEGFFA